MLCGLAGSKFVAKGYFYILDNLCIYFLIDYFNLYKGYLSKNKSIVDTSKKK